MEASALPDARAVLFDLDGTLLDTLEDLGRSINAVLAREGFPLHTLRAYKRFVGEGITLLVRRSLPREAGVNEAVVDRLVEALRREYSAHCMDATHAYDGISGILAALGERGIVMAILSNKPEDMVTTLVEHYFSRVPFGEVMGAREGLPRKPDPAGARAIAQKLGIAPEKFIFLGDSKTDMETATAAGMYPVGALWGFRDAKELCAFGAKRLIKQPEELLEMLEG